MAAVNKGGIVRVSKRDSSYAIIDPYFLSDERLSWKAKGLLGYLLSKPTNWRNIRRSGTSTGGRRLRKIRYIYRTLSANLSRN